ncbi:MAG: hypothetical protein INQ03_00425 [Candidatus Heimdallarchaeota archaeon]|nr:hypothetical protein [Candidatus Heimdallarchaeota archaeon]
MVNSKNLIKSVENEEIKSITIKFGGSVLYNSNKEIDVELIKKYGEIISKLNSQGIKVSLVVGGGITTRNFVKQLKSDISNKAKLDHISIRITQLHVEIVRMILEDVTEKMDFTSYNDLISYSWEYKVPVIGGLYPGQSTNGTAAMVSEVLESDLLVNCFGYDHIASKDPTEFDDGEKLAALTYDQLSKFIEDQLQEPGHYELFDKIALNTVKRSEIPVLFVNGRKPEQILKFLQGMKIGSLVS